MRTLAGVALDRVRPQGVRPMALLQRGLVYLGAAFAALVLAGIVGYICVMVSPSSSRRCSSGSTTPTTSRLCPRL